MNIEIKMYSIFYLLIFIVFSVNAQGKKPNFPVLKGPYLGQKPPGLIPEVFAPGIISHGFHEHNLTISPDGKYLFFAANSTRESFQFKNKSYIDLITQYKSYRNGYGTIYWVDAKIIEELKPEELK